MDLSSLSSRRLRGSEIVVSAEEKQAKVNEIRKMIGPAADKFGVMCSDDSILRYLRARNWNTKRACRMLKATLKWRMEYKPEIIRWEDVAVEAETGKIYRASYVDKHGRIVLVMRPGYQNTNSSSDQIKYLVYCMENAVQSSNENQEQMVWLIDFQGWSTSSISMKVTRETVHILQNHYPERLGLAILYNPPKVFESFWKMVKPLIEKNTFKKVKFVYSGNQGSREIMEEVFEADKLEAAFGGRNSGGFDYQAYAERMRQDDKRMSDLVEAGSSSPTYPSSLLSESHGSDSLASFSVSDASDDGRSSGDEATSSTPDDKTQN